MFSDPVWLRVTCLFAAAQVAALIALFVAGVPLGKLGTFVYPYSPIIDQRLLSPAVVAGVALAALLAGAVRLCGSADRGRRAVGHTLLDAGWLGVGLWTFFAPPHFLAQHCFNLLSPSHDGAFIREAWQIDRVRTYLAQFPNRARTPPERMRGTRVISNPPGATLLAVVAGRAADRSAWLDGWIAEIDPAAADLPQRDLHKFRHAVLFAALLTLLWVAAGPLCYAVARVWLPPASAAAISTLALVSPATLLFSPGKDPAQLLTVGLPLLAWSLAVRPAIQPDTRTDGRAGAAASLVWAAVAGVLFLLAVTMSLVHVWIAAIVLAASIAATWRAPAARRDLALRMAAALVGAILALASSFVFGLNLPAALLAVAHSQAEVMRGPTVMPAAWQMLGLPLFLLFCGPALPALVGVAFRRWLSSSPARLTNSHEPAAGSIAAFGHVLVLLSVFIMLATVTFTNAETPRLWIPFTPLFLLGAALSLTEHREPSPVAARTLSWIVFIQLVVSVAQWTLMDMREAETRLLLDPSGAARMFE